MVFDANKKVLFVTGMDQELARFLQRATHVKPENMFLLQTYGPEISHSFGDLMRDIIIAVYQVNIEEICVVGINGQKSMVDIHDLRNRICEQSGIKENIQTIDYLFENCMPEFPSGSFDTWLEGSKTLIEGIQKSVEILRHHPLMPSYINVYGLLLDKENEKLSEIDVPQMATNSL